MSIYRRVLNYYRPFVLQTMVALALSLIGIGLNLLKPWPFKWIVDSLIPIGREFGLHDPPPIAPLSFVSGPVPFLLLVLCLSLVAIQFLWGISNWWTNYIFVKF